MLGGIDSIVDVFADKVGLVRSNKVKTVTAILERPVANHLLEAVIEIRILILSRDERLSI